jgi:uncharacterized membrane protein
MISEEEIHTVFWAALIGKILTLQLVFTDTLVDRGAINSRLQRHSSPSDKAFIQEASLAYGLRIRTLVGGESGINETNC